MYLDIKYDQAITVRFIDDVDFSLLLIFSAL